MATLPMLGQVFGIFEWWQILAIILLIALIIFYVKYRNRQV